ncbi:hypothetical protein AYS81_003557 [Salmonella enterica subsp. enterica serovar Lexington]|nr:hypothetical protein [Salmonella enterica subsp. enterica serovar Lexington]
MLMALKYRGYSIRYRHSSLKVDNRRRSTVSRLDNRLSSKHIFRRHYFLQSFQRKILCYLISTDRIGTLPLCQSGRWKDINFSFRVGATFQVWPGQTVNLGRFKLCINSYRIDGRELAITELIPTDGPDEKGYMNWRATNATQYSPYYMGIHCFI